MQLDTKLNKIKGYRNMLGLTQDEFADAVSITTRTYYNKEKGISQFTVDELLRIKDYLNSKEIEVTLEDLI